MRAVLTNFGTTGDIQPFLALASEMRRRGHKPVIAFSPNFAARVESLGFEFVPIGPNLEKVQREIIIDMLTPRSSVEHRVALYAPLVAALPQMFEELRDVCRGASVLVCGPVQPAGRMVHEVTGIPFVSVQVNHFNGGGTPDFREASRLLINPFRAKLGLAPLEHPLTIDANSPQLALYAVSRHVLPPATPWPSHYHMTGYFFFDEDGWQPDPALVEFIDAGDAPVVITFGSGTYEDVSALGDMVLEGVRLAGCRAIVQRGWCGLAVEKKLPANVYAIGYVPHHWLFPRAACVVHHGGAGTSAAGFRSGVPSIFVTHAGGQPIRAQLAAELGCAVPAISFWNLTAERLGAAIKTTLDTPAYQQRAAALGEKIRSEHGVGRALSLIEDLLAKLGLDYEHDEAERRQLSTFEQCEEKITRRKHYQQQRRFRKTDKPLAVGGATPAADESGN